MNGHRLVRGTAITLAAAALCLATAAPGQSPSDRRPLPQRPGAQLPPAGFWPTDRMMDLAIDRMTENMADRYGFDAEQLERTRETLKTRFPGWLNENRAQIQTLVNEWFEGMLSPEPPTPEQAADWARRVQPLFQQGVGLVENTMDDMRGYLNEDQVDRIEMHRAGLRVATGIMQERLDRWAQGGFEPSEWPRDPAFHSRHGADEKVARDQIQQAELASKQLSAVRRGLNPDAMPTPGTARPAPPAGGDPTAGGMAPGGGPVVPPTAIAPAATPDTDEWSIYVEQFIQKHKLDEAQQNKARELLRQAQAQRTRYLSNKRRDVAALEKKFESAKAPADQEAVRAEYQKLTAPLDREFDKLKRGLDRLLNKQQRDAAAATAQPAPAPSPAKSPGPDGR